MTRGQDDDEFDDRRAGSSRRRRGRRASGSRRRIRRAGTSTSAAAQRSVRVGQESCRRTERDAPPFHPGEEPRAFDGEGDEQQADPATIVANPADAREMSAVNAMMPTKGPMPIAAFAYQVAVWIGESRNARIGLRARRASPRRPAVSSAPGATPIPGEANVASPGIRADASPARIRSSPTTRTAPPITSRWARVARRSPPGGPRSRR